MKSTENNETEMCYYFAYGSNMNPNRMLARGVSFIKRELGELQGYTLVFNKMCRDGTAAANILPDENSAVYGALYTCADDDVHIQLDKYEGVSSHQYSRTKYLIKLENATYVCASVYIANPDRCKTGLPIHPSYLEHLLDGKDILPPDYFDFLCSFKIKLLKNVPVYHYFAYGSDINPAVIQSRGVKFTKRQLGCLSGYKLCFNKVKSSNGLAVANILPCEESSVFGALYTFYDFHPFNQLDIFNGVKCSQYIRNKVNIHLADGTNIEADVYIAHNLACRDNLKIDSEHFDNIMAGKDILPLDYMKYLISCQKEG